MSVKVMGQMILEVLTALTEPHAVCSWLQDRGPGLSKATVSVSSPPSLTRAPKPATVEEALDHDSGALGPVPRLAAWDSVGSTGSGVRIS